MRNVYRATLNRSVDHDGSPAEQLPVSVQARSDADALPPTGASGRPPRLAHASHHSLMAPASGDCQPLLDDGKPRPMREAPKRCCSPSHLDHTDFEDSDRWDCSACYYPLQWPLVLCCFKAVRAATCLARLP